MLGSNLLSALEELACVVFNLCIVVCAHYALCNDLFLRDVHVVTLVGLCCGRDDGLGGALVLLHALGQLHAADLAASVLVGTPCRSCEDGADNHFNFETFAVKAHGDHGVGCSQFPVGADVACCVKKLCCDLVQDLSFEGNALGQDNVECRDSVCCHHDDELVVDVVHVTHLAVIYTFLSVKMEICLCKCFHLCL